MDTATATKLMGYLGVGPDDLRAILSATNISQAMSALVTFKERVRSGWKQAAFKLHPDRGGDEDLFKQVSSLVDQLLNLKIAHRPAPAPSPRPVQQWVNFTNSTGNSTTSGCGGPVRVTWTRGY